MNIYNNGRVTLTVGDIERMQQRIVELERESAELVARLVELSKMHSDLTNADMVLDCNGEQSGYLITDEQIDEMEHLLSVDAQCLNQIKADAGRAGYVQAIHDLGYKDSCLTDRANKYAERVKAGEP
jgi:hypothetical protein